MPIHYPFAYRCAEYIEWAISFSALDWLWKVALGVDEAVFPRQNFVAHYA
ncbi:hypothetical protein ALT721_1970044 [Alteromonas alvinellae]